MKFWEVTSTILSALVAGMFWGPWAALTRSIDTFSPEVFLPIVNRLNRNMAPLMTVLLPASLLSIIPLLILSYRLQSTFYLVLTSFFCFSIALIVTVVVEVPIVQEISKWTVGSLPADWKQRRDRWSKFHVVRVLCGFLGFACLVLADVSH